MLQKGQGYQMNIFFENLDLTALFAWRVDE